MERHAFPHLTDLQWEALGKMQFVLANLCAQGAEAQIERINQFAVYEHALISHIQGAIQVPQAHVPASQVTVQTRAEQGGLRPLRLRVPTFDGKDGENLLFWVREMDVAINAAMIREEHLKVAFAVSHLGGRAKTWALTRANTLDASFPTWEYLQHELALTFQPPNSAY